MENLKSEILQKIKEQYDRSPYPRIAIEKLPSDILDLYFHNLVTSYYLRNKQVVFTEGKTILDVGCGSGYTTLILAKANPGAKIIGIDISEQSLELAQQRLQYHGFDNIEFHSLLVEDLPQLGMEFDYINCDELLYFLPDITVGLKAMKAVLKPEGIIRANVHSSLQRVNYYQAQSVFKMMGLLDENPTEMEVDLVREIYKSLKDGVKLKQSTWKPNMEKDEELVMMNLLIQGDRGYTVPEVFSALEAANLEFISMLNWRQWEIMDLFSDRDNIPTFLAFSLPEVSLEDKLHLFELLHPIHRLLDFWCGHPDRLEAVTPIDEWTISDWQKVKVHLHPQLKTPEMKEDLFQRIKKLQPFEIGKHLPTSGKDTLIDNSIAACILPPLLESPQPIDYLVQRWQKLHPVDALTLESTTYEEAFEIIRQVIIGREADGHLLLER